MEQRAERPNAVGCLVAPAACAVITPAALAWVCLAWLDARVDAFLPEGDA
jgi:hypothetical protein